MPMTPPPPPIRGVIELYCVLTISILFILTFILDLPLSIVSSLYINSLRSFLQRKVSLSTLQSKAAKRREEVKKKPKPKPVKKVKPPKEVKQNGPAVNGIRNQKMKDSQTLIPSNDMELQPITVTVDVRLSLIRLLL